MNATCFENLLNDIEACDESKGLSKGKSLAECWTKCHRGDWLLLLCSRMIGRPGWPSLPALIIACAACAETSLRLDDLPHRVALDTARRWAKGEASTQDVKESLRGCIPLKYAVGAVVLTIIRSPKHAHRCASFASDAPDGSTEKLRSLKQCADICRALLTVPT